MKILPISKTALTSLIDEAMSFEPLFAKHGLVFPLVRTGDGGARLRPDVGRPELEQLFNILNQGPALSSLDLEKVGLADYAKEKLTLPARWTYPQIRIDCQANQGFASPWHRDKWILGDGVKGLIVWFCITEEGGNLAVTHDQDFAVVSNEYWGLEAKYRDEAAIEVEEVHVEYGNALVFDESLVHKSMPLASGQITVQLRYHDLADRPKADYTPLATQKKSSQISAYQTALAAK